MEPDSHATDRKFSDKLRQGGISVIEVNTIALRVLASLPKAVTNVIRPRDWGEEDLPLLPVPRPGKKNLLIGPANSAGQARLWAESANEVPGWAGSNIAYVRAPRFSHESDAIGLEKAVVYSPQWARTLRKRIVNGYSAIIIESLQPLFGSLHFQDPTREIRYLQRHGLKVGVLWHGSDIRDPGAHAANVNGSVFLNAPAESVNDLHSVVQRNLKRLAATKRITTFVSTPDLLRYQPNATWLPIQVHPSFLHQPLQPVGGSPPTVLHLPSRGYLKGTKVIDRHMRSLARSGIIHYVTPQQVPHSAVRRILEDADIVIDQIGMDAYGVASLEALALGKTVVAQVGTFVREQVGRRTGMVIPIQEANADTIKHVVQSLAQHPAQREKLAYSGREYVRVVHSPQAAAAALASFLND